MYSSVMIDVCQCGCQDPKTQEFSDAAYWRLVQKVAADVDVTEYPNDHNLWLERFAEEVTHPRIAQVCRQLKLTFQENSTKMQKMEIILRQM